MKVFVLFLTVSTLFSIAYGWDKIQEVIEQEFPPSQCLLISFGKPLLTSWRINREYVICQDGFECLTKLKDTKKLYCALYLWFGGNFTEFKHLQDQPYRTVIIHSQQDYSMKRELSSPQIVGNSDGSATIICPNKDTFHLNGSFKIGALCKYHWKGITWKFAYSV